MKILNSILILVFANLFVKNVEAQDLSICKLSDTDKKNNIIRKYEYTARDHYGIIKLSLFANSTFWYELSTFRRELFSEGIWIQKKDSLILNSYITNRHIPIKLIYSNDSSTLIGGFKIGIVRNLTGDYLKDGMININNDSIKCVPEGGFCTAAYASFDSIKVVFENGLYSDWIKVEEKKYAQIIPVIQTKFPLSSYQALDNQKYLVLKSSLRPIN